MNHELYELCSDIDIVKNIEITRMPWLGYVVRMEDTAPAKKVCKDSYYGKRKQGRPRLRWRNQVKKVVEKYWKFELENVCCEAVREKSFMRQAEDQTTVCNGSLIMLDLKLAI